MKKAKYKLLFLLFLIVKTSSSQCSFTTNITTSGPTNICESGSVALSATASSNTWTQKSNFGGANRMQAVSFSIGNKGYVGTGLDVTYKNDFWEYDPATNSWSQKANVGGSIRGQATGFSIGTKGYIGLGANGNNYLNDFWEYDPITNSWTQKLAFSGSARVGATGFGIGNKGYMGTGWDGAYTNDFWEFDPSLNTWTQKTNFASGLFRSLATSFNIGTKGYVGLGADQLGYKNDFWEYDPSNDSWLQKANYGGVARASAGGFAIGNKGYIGNGINNSGVNNDYWMYDGVTNLWYQIANFGGLPRANDISFAIGNNGYVGTGGGTGSSPYSDLWEYSPTLTYSWSTGALTQSISAINSGTYVVLINSVAGCTASASQTVAVNPNPTISASNGTICLGNSFVIVPNGASTYSITGNSTTVAPITNTSYTIIGVTAGCSGSTTVDVLVDQCTRLSEQHAHYKSLKIYPNPCIGKLNIEFEIFEEAKISITLSDLSGRELKCILPQTNYRDNSINLTCDLSDLKSGIYFMRVFVNNKIEVSKLVISD